MEAVSYLINTTHRSSHKILGFSCQILKELQFCRQLFEKSPNIKFRENPQISNFMKIRSLGAEIFHADRRTDKQTDMTKLIFAFRNFANAPKFYHWDRVSPGHFRFPMSLSSHPQKRFLLEKSWEVRNVSVNNYTIWSKDI